MANEAKIEDIPKEDLDETSVTMLDVLAQEKELEEESAAVLGGSDEKFCTYPKGYIKRQALYSCLTCCPDARNDLTKGAGICLACSYQCHEHHELIELYTKRNFRCDCPTERLGGKKCTFVTENESTSATGTIETSMKLDKNHENEYNQNFSGLYCTCKRPYPDPEDTIQDEMIQCIMCEDWYHTRHLNTSAPSPDMYSEMICGDCMNAYSFLRDYAGIAVNKIAATAENHDVSITTEDDEKLKSELDKSISEIMNITPDSSDEQLNECGEPFAKRTKLDESINICKRPILGSNYKKGAVFWPENWRKTLCSCPTCSTMYSNQKASFLLDPEDTVQFYEENGLKKVRETDYDRGLRALSSMERTQQIDAITEYNKMKDKLKEFLHTFVVNQKVVTEEDINRFFQGMKNEKNANLGQPYFCR